MVDSRLTKTVESEIADKGELLHLALKRASKYYQKNSLWHNIPVNNLMEVEKLTMLISFHQYLQQPLISYIEKEK